MIKVVSKEAQAYGAFNNGEIVENKPIGFTREGGELKPYSSLFYWANAIAKVDSTIGLHPHQGFEIMSFVLDGEIRHFDTQANAWKPLQKGDAQVIRAGNGISHSEFMAEGGRMFQIWLDPNLSKTMQQAASYDDYRGADFTQSESAGLTITHYAGDKGLMQLDTPGTSIQRWAIDRDISQSISLSTDQVASIYGLEGAVTINDEALAVDAYAVVEDENEIRIQGKGEVFVIISPKQTAYTTYAAMMQQRMG